MDVVQFKCGTSEHIEKTAGEVGYDRLYTITNASSYFIQLLLQFVYNMHFHFLFFLFYPLLICTHFTAT